MRIAAILALLLTASTAVAVTYKWEDSRGVHFTDDFNSVPGELRTRAVPEDDHGMINFGKTVPLQSSSDVEQKNLPEIERMERERERIVMEAIRQHQAEMINQMSQHSSELRKRFIRIFADEAVIRIVPLVLLAPFWMLALIDITRRPFTVPAHKYIWLALVLFLAPLGVVAYFFLGRGRKSGSASATE